MRTAIARWCFAFERWSYAARREHAQLATRAEAAVEALARRFLGETSTAAGADPFCGILPWELTTASALRVRKDSASGTLDITYGKQLFDFAGVCVIDGALSPSLTAALRDESNRLTNSVRAAVSARGIEPDGVRGFRFHEACQRGPGRYNMRVVPTAAPQIYEDPELSDADAAWMPLVRRILGDECRLLFEGIVVSEPGATPQALHSDGPHLDRATWLKHEPPPPWHHHHHHHACDDAAEDLDAAAAAAAATLPCHALTVFVPLVDLCTANGATEFLPGTHHCAIATAALDAEASEAGSTSGAGAPARLEVSAGAAVVFDYRTFHAGGANASPVRRPILYRVYGRRWFEDNFNFPTAEVASLHAPVAVGHGQSARAGGTTGSGLATGLAPERVEALLGITQTKP